MVLISRLGFLNAFQAQGVPQRCEPALPLQKTLVDWDVKCKADPSTPPRFLGLLVKDLFAMRFVDKNPDKRKTVEVRTQPVRFLNEGERCLLVSCSKEGRRALAVLEFQACVSYESAHFSRYFALHRVTKEEFAGYTKATSWFGYHFEMVHVFAEPLKVNFNSGERWIWIPAGNFSEPSRKRAFKDDPKPSVTRLKTVSSLGENREAENSEEDEGQEEDENDENEDDVMESQGDVEFAEGKVMCFQLSPSEWNAFCQGRADSVVRPFRSAFEDLHILVTESKCVSLVGRATFPHGQVSKVESWSSDEIKQLKDEEVYSKQQVANMKSNKAAWIWQASDIEVYDQPLHLRFLTNSPKFRNRPFALTQQQVQNQSENLNYPSRLDLQETAQFFIGQLSDDLVQSLRSTVRALAAGSGKIRVGTTCSGTDIVVKVLEKTVQELNRLEAWFSQTIYIYYIYIYT